MWPVLTLVAPTSLPHFSSLCRLQVEWVCMRAMSQGLITGTIDEVRGYQVY